MNTVVKKTTNSTQKTSTIYRQIIKSIDSLLKKFKGDTSPDAADIVQELDATKKNAYDLLKSIRNEIVSNLETLEKNADWDTFTIAFYGETNAGKSTIIETLRIMYDEPEKGKTQAKFRALQQQLNIDQSSIDEVRKNILQQEKIAEAHQKIIDQVSQKNNEEMTRLSTLLGILESQLEEKKQSLNIFQKMIAIYRHLPEKTKVIEHKELIIAQEKKLSNVLEKFENKLHEPKAILNNLYMKHDEMLAQLEQLKPLADGNIIGDGRSDYTLDSQRYVVEETKQKFALLDVPGIEGKEEKVGESIWQAVQKAHTVFYVTGKAAAPQTGDENTKGTLEKIKEHLGDQTEVWSIFNKRITNPLQLQKPLISSGEKESLRALDEKMHEQLGENYKGNFSVCGLVGFLAVANCLVSGHENSKRKEKFMANHDAQHLLSYSGITDFKRMLSEEFVKDFKAKIKRANLNKANQSLKKASTSILNLREDKFVPLYAKLQQEADAANHQLDAALNTLKSDLRALSGRSVEEFKSNIHNKMYERINEQIDNKDFKIVLQETITHAQQEFDNTFPVEIKEEINSFSDSIKNIIERFQQHSDELLGFYDSLATQGFSESFNPKVNIDNGINMKGLIGTVAGTVALALTPAGWAIMALGAVGLVISFLKSVGSFFSSNYRKSQQRMSTDENIERMAKILENTIDKNITEAIPKVESHIEVLKKSLNIPVDNTKIINDLLFESINHLHKITNKIEKAI